MVGKVAEVGEVPCGASPATASAPPWAQAAVASDNTSTSTNSPVFFMLPPGGTACVPLPCHEKLNARKERLQPEGNKLVRVGQGYEGVGDPGAEVFVVFLRFSGPP